jgi:hypothetical protein
MPSMELKGFAITLLSIRVAGIDMFQFLTARRSAAAAAATLVAGFAVFVIPAMPVATAQPHISTIGSHAKGDRLPVFVMGSACSSQSWPTYDRKCQFDLRKSADDVRQVRIVSLIRRTSPAVN